MANIVETVVRDLCRDEGFRSSAYQDSEGFWTIGYGTLIDERLGAGITEAEAQILLRNRVVSATVELDQKLSWWVSLPDNVRIAVANMAFNLGVPRLLKFEKMISALREQRWDAAANEALDSKWARQVGARAQRIADLIRSGG